MLEQILNKSVELIREVASRRNASRNLISSNSRLYSHPSDKLAELTDEELKEELLLVRQKKSKLSSRFRDFLSATLTQAAILVVQQEQIAKGADSEQVQEQGE